MKDFDKKWGVGVCVGGVRESLFGRKLHEKKGNGVGELGGHALGMENKTGAREQEQDQEQGKGEEEGGEGERSEAETGEEEEEAMALATRPQVMCLLRASVSSEGPLRAHCNPRRAQFVVPRPRNGRI
jgi:hypothetical protein